METKRNSPDSERDTLSLPPINSDLLRAGDEATWTNFVNYSRPILLGIAYKSGSQTPEEAEDVYSDALIKLFESRERIDLSNPQAYVARCIVNRNIDLARRKKIIRIDSYDLITALRDEMHPLLDRVESPYMDSDPSPEEIVIQMETRDEVNSIVSALPPTTQQTLNQQFFEGLTPGKMAEINGTTRALEKSRFFRARDAFRKAYVSAEIQLSESVAEELIDPNRENLHTAAD